MARNKEEQARLEGMAQALRIAKEKGVVSGVDKQLRHIRICRRSDI